MGVGGWEYEVGGWGLRVGVDQLPEGVVPEGIVSAARRGGTRYRGASLIRNHILLGPYSRAMPRAMQWSWGGGAV